MGRDHVVFKLAQILIDSDDQYAFTSNDERLNYIISALRHMKA